MAIIAHVESLPRVGPLRDQLSDSEEDLPSSAARAWEAHVRVQALLRGRWDIPASPAEAQAREDRAVLQSAAVIAQDEKREAVRRQLCTEIRRTACWHSIPGGVKAACRRSSTESRA